MVYNFKIRFLFYNYSLIVKTLQNCCFFLQQSKENKKYLFTKKLYMGIFALRAIITLFIHLVCKIWK